MLFFSLSLSNHLELLFLPSYFFRCLQTIVSFFSHQVLAERNSIPQFCMNTYIVAYPRFNFFSSFPSLSIIIFFTFIISLDNFHVYFPSLSFSLVLFILSSSSTSFFSIAFISLSNNFHLILSSFQLFYQHSLSLFGGIHFSLSLLFHSPHTHIYIQIHNLNIFFFLREEGGRGGLSKSFARIEEARREKEEKVEKPKKDEDTHLESRRQDLEKGGKKRGDEGRVRFSPSTTDPPRHVPLRGASASILLPLRLRHTSPSGSTASTAYQPYTGCCESGVLRFSRTLGSLVSPPFCSRTLVSRAPVLVKSVRVSRFGHHPDLSAPTFHPSRVFASFFHPFSPTLAD